MFEMKNKLIFFQMFKRQELVFSKLTENSLSVIGNVRHDYRISMSRVLFLLLSYR